MGDGWCILFGVETCTVQMGARRFARAPVAQLDLCFFLLLFATLLSAMDLRWCVLTTGGIASLFARIYIPLQWWAFDRAFYKYRYN